MGREDMNGSLSVLEQCPQGVWPQPGYALHANEVSSLLCLKRLHMFIRVARIARIAS